jgi:hypothetical protein
MSTRFAPLLLLLASCGAAPETTPANTGAYVPGAPPAASASPADYARCQAACSTLTACGVPFGPTCPTDCMATPVFRACVQTAPVTDCNALALCAFQQGAAASCGGQPGVPAGTQSCATAALCEGMCTVADQPAACSCACAASLAPGKAIKLLINNQCAVAKCGAVCRPGASGAACLACFQANCQAENAQCAADTTTSAPVPPPAPAPTQTLPTPEAQAGELDPLLFGLWPLAGVDVFMEGATLPDAAASAAVTEKLGPQTLQLGSDGLYFMGAGRGTWRTVPFTAEDRARWGTGGLGPQGYARKLVLTNGEGVTLDGPITDPPPAGSAPIAIKLGASFAGPPPGHIVLNFVRRLNAPSPGVKR